jgi:16S rRNA (cytidine1402-2'-O)-methyltransferase
MPALYVVATPIGNLEDITLRAMRVLKEVKLIAAEDTRKTRKLLTAYGIKTPTTSYHEHNKLTKLDYILGRLENDDVALVSDAGTPGISDPGHELICAVLERGITIVPVPGASVLISSLAVSGLSTSSFSYLGFLPHRSGPRRSFLTLAKAEPRTLVFFESPHRLRESLEDMLSILGDRRLTICRELTKLHEEIFHGSIGQAIEKFGSPRGEFTLVVEGGGKSEKPAVDSAVEKRFSQLARSGHKAREAVSELAHETGLSRKELYRSWLKSKIKNPGSN